MSNEIKDVISAFTKVEKNIYNSQRRAVRRGVSAAYEAAWKITHSHYPTLKKKKGSDTRPFASRITKQSFFNPDNMGFSIEAETRKFSLLNAIQGDKNPENQTGLKIKQRRTLKFRLGIPYTPTKKPFVLKMKGKRFVTTREKEKYKTQMRPSLHALLTESQNKDFLITSAIKASEEAFERI